MPSKPLRLPPKVPVLESTLPSPLSIAMVAACPFPSQQGTQLLIRHLATMLTAAGHDVHLITYGYGETEAPLPFPVHRSAHIDVGNRSGPNWSKPAADVALAHKARRVIGAEGCDLLHVHNAEGLAIGTVLKRETGLPLIYHAHNSMSLELPTYFRARWVRAVASVFGQAFDRTLPRTADQVITFDPDHKAFHALHGVDPNRIQVIRPGLLGDELGSPTESAVAWVRDRLGPGRWLLYAGNPDGYQNLGMLFEALALVRRENPDVKLVVASHHPPKSFDADLDASGCREGVTVFQHRNIEELRALFAIAEIGVCPRRLWAGAPIKVLNYLAAGLGVVACRAASRHLVPPEAGILTDDTPEAFAAGVLQALAGSHRFGKKQTERAYAPFRIDGHLADYEAVYSRALSTKRRAVHANH